MKLEASSIEYNDYLGMMVYTDSEWTRRRIPTDINGVEADKLKFKNDLEFSRQCQALKAKVNENYRRFREGNSLSILNENEYCVGTKKEGYLAKHLLNPINYIPFGHADSLSMVLLDDFDSIHCLTADNKTTIEEVDLFFCPKMESLFDEGEEVPPIFCNLHDMISPVDIIREVPRVHAFQQQYPLMVFTKHKIGGMPSLCGGVYLEQFIYKAMAKKIGDVWKGLREHRDDPAVKVFFGDKESQDIENIRVCFLDLQSAEEIGTLVFCQNYSVAMSLISSLRYLNFSNLFDCSSNNELNRYFDQNKAHQNLVKLTTHNDKHIEGNHIFRWTYSSLAICTEAYQMPEKYPYFGKVESLSEVQISPGHSPQMEQKIIKPHQEQEPDIEWPQEYYVCKTGIPDVLLRSRTGKGENNTNLIDLKYMVDVMRRNQEVFGSKNNSNDYGRDVIDIITSLGIPIPNLTSFYNNDIRTDEHASHLSETLLLLQHRLFYSKVDINEFERSIADKAIDVPKGSNTGKMELSNLRDKLIYIGLPISLRRAIEFLYQYYATILADPFHFDTVLDLYDSFSTLYMILTELLPQKKPSRKKYTIDSCNDEIIEQVSSFVKAMRNALQHRMAKAYPQTSIRDMGIDLRGGVNQIILGANSSLLSGLDLFKKYQEEINGRNSYSVGGLTCIGFLPGAICNSLAFGTEDDAKIAYFEVDVSHIFHVASYSNYFHETFHLIFDDLYEKYLKDEIDDDSQLKDRLSEIFSNILCKEIIYDGNIDQFLFSTLCSFSRSSVSTDTEDWDTVVRYYDIFLRLFMATDEKGKSSKTPFERFQEMVVRYGPLCSEYKRLWDGSGKETINEYSKRQFYLLYPTLSRYMLYWEKALTKIKDFYERNVDYENLSEIQETIKDAFASGKPLVATTQSSEIRMNLVFLICSILREYMPNPQDQDVDIFNKKMHLIRSDDRQAIYNKDGGKWYEFQIEKGATSMFCPIPYERKKRLLKQIVFLKSVWGFSLIQRQARFNEIINDTCELKID